MAEPTRAHARELVDYLLIARRRWRWIVGGAVVGLAAGAGLPAAREPHLRVDGQGVGGRPALGQPVAEGARTNDLINLDTEAQLVKSDAVVAEAAKAMGTETRGLASRVTITVPANTTVLNITFRAPTAVEAQSGAQAFADAYLLNRETSALDKLSDQEARLQGEIELLTAKITKLGTGIHNSNGPGQQADRAFLVAKRTALNSQLEQFQADLAPVKDAAVYPGEISNEATRPKTPVDPNPLLILPSGLMAGLLVGVVLAGLRERRDKRIHAAVDVERIFGVKPLARMPWGDGSLGSPTGVRVDADMKAVYHSLRANGPVTTESVVVVAPEAPLEGERLAFSLGFTAARAGASTVYVTRPGTVSASDRSVAAGAAGLLNLPDYESIDAVVGGEVHAAALAKRLRMLRSKHDFLVLGLPNDNPVVDLPLLGRQADVAVLVIALGRTERTSVEAVLTRITKSGIEHVAVVVLDKPHRRARHRTQQLSVITAAPESGTGERKDPLADAVTVVDRFAHPEQAGGTPAPGVPATPQANGKATNGSARNGNRNGGLHNGGARPVARPGGETRP